MTKLASVAAWICTAKPLGSVTELPKGTLSEVAVTAWAVSLPLGSIRHVTAPVRELRKMNGAVDGAPAIPVSTSYPYDGIGPVPSRRTRYAELYATPTSKALTKPPKTYSAVLHVPDTQS